MNTIAVLMGLLLLSYVGSFFGRGLAGGSEYLALGVLAGPLALGFVTRSGATAFDPIVYVAIGWLALASGLEYGWARGHRIAFGRVFEGVLLGAFSGLVVAVGVFFATPLVTHKLALADRYLLAGGIGCACAETTRGAVRWVSARYESEGPLTELLADLSNADELVPIGALAILLALRAPARATVHLPPLAWAGATILVGLVLGLVTAMLLARDLRIAESWGTILGTSLLAIGLAARLDLAAITAMFACGAAIAWTSRHHGSIRRMVVATERSVLLPTLVLAGARIDAASIGRLALLVPVAILLRVASKMLVGFFIRGHAAARDADPLLGVALASSGGMSVAIGLAMAIRFPGTVGDTVLAVAIASTMVGELSGPALRIVLLRAGELHERPRADEAPVDDDEEAAADHEPEDSDADDASANEVTS